ncbi:MAG: carboxyl transferase domain-containing protein [bacterium]
MRRIGIVNRGEPAIRFLNALDALRREKPAPAAVALYTRPDTDSLYVRSADAAICIGEGRAAYLDAGAVIAALRETGCDGAWLGWGFASEDAAFCTALEDAGITLLAPRPDSMARLGDKVAAKRLAEEYGVPVAAWAVVRDAADALAAAERVGYPLMIKAAGGGGGRGIRRVESPDALPALFAAVRAEADRSFHGGDIFIERCVDGARHVEVQVLGDGAGRVLVYGVRECSLQRRRQKIVEECPSVGLSEEARALLVASAERLCAAVAYRSAGTVEFLYDDRTDRACFLEVNSRLQVEHPVTEEVYGADLVRAQIELALGEPLPPAVAAPRGWAIEARVCAEDPHNDFAPAPGRLVRFVLPTGPGLRVDTGFSEGETISSDFDPLVAKVIAWGADRGVALARLAHALDQTRIVVEGGTTNLAFLRALLARDDVRAGRFDVGTVDRLRVEAPPGQGVAALAAAIDRFLAAGDEDDSRGPDRHRVEAGDALAVYRLGPDRFRVLHESGEVTVHYEADGPYQRWLSIGGARHRVERVVGDRSYVVDGTPHRVAAAGAGAVAAPSAAVVLDVLVAPGDRVEAGQTVAVLESMKMEVRVDTPRAGEVREVFVTAGGQVRAGQVMLLIDAEGAATVAEPATTGIPWQAGPPAAEAAAERLRAAFTGWDAPPGTLRGDAAHVDPQDFAALLGVFADVAELLERRPDRQPDGGEGATDAVSPALWIETLRRQGQDALAARPRIALARALAHHGAALDAAPAVVDDALRRLARAELALPELVPAAAALLRRAADQPPVPEGRPCVPLDLLDRLTLLDPARFGPVREAADRARYRLHERPDHVRFTQRAEERAEELLRRLRAGEIGWDELIAAPESLVPGFAPAAVAEGCLVAAEGVARRLEWTGGDMPIEPFRLAGRPAFRVGEGDQAVVCVVARPAEAGTIVIAASSLPPTRRLDLVLVPPPGSEPAKVMDAVIALAPLGRAPRPPWDELCILVVRGPNYPMVRRFMADGTERRDRRDVMPSTARRLDLDRLDRFEFERLPSDDDVVLFHARARDNRDDVRLLAFGEVRSIERASGSRFRLPHVERVFHAAVRAIETARATHDPRRRLQWNRITLRIVPPVPHKPDLIRRYVERLAPAAQRVGLEKVVVRAAFTDADGEAGELRDLAISDRGGLLEFVEKPASHKALMPLTRYETRVVAARRRGLVHPYEIVRLLEGSPELPRGRFEEYDLDAEGRPAPVDRFYGENTAGVVFGLIRSSYRHRADAVTRVLVLSDPTESMGALAEPECRRILAAIELAAERQIPLEWVALSAGARIDWDTGTENLDWTARVLGRIVRFTQDGGEIDLIVPGICVGAQAYWNAEATMMMHTRGLLVMTDRGAMVLTGKRALDASGCVSADDDLALGGYTAIMGPNGQAQAHAPDLGAAFRLLYRYHDHTHVPPGAARPPRLACDDPLDRDVTAAPYPGELGHGFATVGQVFSTRHNPDRKRPFAVRPVMAAVSDAGVDPVERWSAWRGAETAVVWETRIGGYGACLIGIENRPFARVGQPSADGPARFAGGTLYPQASRKVARALNAASGRRPVVVLANLSGFDGSPESLGQWQLEYGAEIGRAVVNFKGPIVFVVLSRYHGGAYVVFSKTLNPELVAVALEGSYASVIGGAPAAAVVFTAEVRRRTAELGGDPTAHNTALAEVAARFDGIHTVDRAREVGSIDGIIAAEKLRPFIVDRLARDHVAHGGQTV